MWISANYRSRVALTADIIIILIDRIPDFFQLIYINAWRERELAQISLLRLLDARVALF